MSTKEKEKFKLVTYADKDIDRQIVAVTKDAKSLKVKLHNLAVSSVKVWHDACHGKGTSTATRVEAAKVACDRINSIQQASPYHSKAFANWVGMMLPFHWSEENKVWYVNVKDDLKLMGKTFMTARDNPFWEVSPPSEPKPFIMAEQIAALIKRAENRIAKPQDGDVVDVAALKFLREAEKVFATQE